MTAATTSCGWCPADTPTAAAHSLTADILLCAGCAAAAAALNALRDAGFAVAAFTPNEIGPADPDRIQEAMIERGWDIVDLEWAEHEVSACIACNDPTPDADLDRAGNCPHCGGDQ